MSWQGQTWDQTQLDALTHEAQELLQEAGLRSGTRVGAFMDNCVLFVVLVRACSRAGMTVVPLSPMLADEAIEEQIRQTDTTLLVATNEHAQRAEQIAPDLALVHASGKAKDWQVRGSSKKVRGSSTTHSRGSESGLVAVLFSSGSTGQPRAWGYPEKALRVHAERAGRRLGFGGDSVALGVLPLHHAGGFMLLDRVDRAGAHLVLTQRFDALEALRLMREHNVTHTSWVPLMLKRVLDENESPPSSLRSVLLGGDAASPQLLERALGAGWPVYPSYGLTETCSQAVTATPDEARRDPRTVGRALEGVVVEVRGEDGGLCRPGQEGRIVIKGETLARGLSDPKDPVDVVTDDHGWLDDEGRLFVTGRDAHRIVTGGHTVSAREVESVLEADPSVAGAVVVGMKDEERGQVVVALIEPSAGGSLDDAGLQSLVRMKLGRFAVPRRIVVTNHLPRTSLGKKNRATALAHVQSAHLETP